MSQLGTKRTRATAYHPQWWSSFTASSESTSWPAQWVDASHLCSLEYRLLSRRITLLQLQRIWYVPGELFSPSIDVVNRPSFRLCNSVEVTRAASPPQLTHSNSHKQLLLMSLNDAVRKPLQPPNRPYPAISWAGKYFMVEVNG